MDRLRKISSKFFKKAPRTSHPPPPPPPLPSQTNGPSKDVLKHARSMPCYDPAIAWAKAAGRCLTPPDNQRVANIAPEKDRGRHKKYQDDCDSSDDEDLYYGQPLSHSTISRFPHPPDTIPPHPSGQYYPYPSTEEHTVNAPNPRYDNWAEEYIDSIRMKPYHPPTLQRSSSNASFSQSTRMAYPSTKHAAPQSGAGRTRTHASTVTYKTKHRNLSIQSFNTEHVPFSRSPVISAPQSRIVDGPVAHRPAIQQGLTYAHHRAVVHGRPGMVPSRPYNRPQGPRGQGIPPHQRLQPNRRPESP